MTMVFQLWVLAEQADSFLSVVKCPFGQSLSYPSDEGTDEYQLTFRTIEYIINYIEQLH